jgi:hypothetical protein
VRENSTRVDEEIVYSGLQETKLEQKKFKRKEKYTSRYKKDRGAKRRKKGRFG